MGENVNNYFVLIATHSFTNPAPQNSLAHIFHKNSISKCKAGYFEPDKIVVKFELIHVPSGPSMLYLIYALSFYRFQNVLGSHKYFVPEKKDDLQSVKLVLVPPQTFLKRH